MLLMCLATAFSLTTSAAATAAIFATLSMLELKMLGVALAVAILVDATIIRLVLLPGVLTLLGERVWRRSLPPATPAVPEPVGTLETPVAAR